MSLETLEVGHMLIAERPRLAALVAGFCRSPEMVDRVVRRAMRAAWRNRNAIRGRTDVISHLYQALDGELQSARRS